MLLFEGWISQFRPLLCCRCWSVRKILGSFTVLTHLSTEIPWAVTHGIIHPGPAALHCVLEVTVFWVIVSVSVFTDTHIAIIHKWKWHWKVFLKETVWCTHSQWLLNAWETQAVQHSSHNVNFPCLIVRMCVNHLKAWEKNNYMDCMYQEHQLWCHFLSSSSFPIIIAFMLCELMARIYLTDKKLLAMTQN